MLRTELRSCLPVYNLLRESMLEVALHSDRTCRSLSLTATLQMIGNLWLASAVRRFGPDVCDLRVAQQTTIRVGHRPGRNEPRVNKTPPQAD